MLCPNCGTDSGKANFCPNCGAPVNQSVPPYPPRPEQRGRVPHGTALQRPYPPRQYVRKPKPKKKVSVVFVVLIVVLVFIAVGLIGSIGRIWDEKGIDSASELLTMAADTINSAAPDDSVSAPIVSTSSAPELARSLPEMTLEQEQAYRKAIDYLNIMSFSQVGLVEQLEFEGFSPEDSAFAVENLDVDWNTQMFARGVEYIQTMPFSKKGLAEQLEHDGFTPEQIDYYNENFTVDWNEQAALSAKNYLDLMAFSRQSLVEQLEHDGFTTEQAIFGADSVLPHESEEFPELQNVSNTVAAQGSDRTVYWTNGGKSYHLSSNCATLKRSTNILSGTLPEALTAGKNDPCNICANG